MPSMPTRLSEMCQTKGRTVNMADRSACLLTNLETLLREEGAEIERLERSLAQTLSITQALGASHVPEANRRSLGSRLERIADRDSRRHRGFCATTVETAKTENAELAEGLLGARLRRLADLFAPMSEMGAQVVPGTRCANWADLCKLVEAQVACRRAHICCVVLQLGLQWRYEGQQPSLAPEDILTHDPRKSSGAGVEELPW